MPKGVTCQLCSVVDVSKTDKVVDVYNFEVSEDHSYIAGGFVVHNCDMYAQANLYGLGKGVFPAEKAPMPPYHPQCLCSALASNKKVDGARFSNERAQEYIKKLPNYKRKAMMSGGDARDWREDLKGYDGELTKKPKALPQRLIKKGKQ